MTRGIAIILASIGGLAFAAVASAGTSRAQFGYTVYEALPGQWAWTVTMRGLFVYSSMQDNVTHATKSGAEAEAKEYIRTKLEGKS